MNYADSVVLNHGCLTIVLHATSVTLEPMTALPGFDNNRDYTSV
jgi:hypothetical protein